MKVAWIPPHFEHGDRTFFPYSFDLGSRLVQRGVEVVIIAPRAFKEPAYEVIEGIQVFRSNDIVLPLKLFHYPIPFHLHSKIVHVVRDLKIDVLNWHGYHYLNAATLPSVKRSTRIPCVVTVIGFPGITWHYPVAAIDRITRMYAYSLGKMILNSADKVVIDFPHNTYGAKKLGVPDSKLVNIPLGIDTEAFKPDPERRTKVRNSLGLKADQFVIGYCGRLSPVKGIDALFEAMALVAKRHENARLLIIGGGGDGLGGSNYEREARALLGDKVIVTGWLKAREVADYMQAVDVAVQPSLAEAGGGAAMEMAASGLPIIASRTGGLQDTIVEGITGYLIEPGDSAALSQRITDFIEHPISTSEMGTAGRKYMLENYSWDSVCDKYIELYSDLTQ